MSDLGEAGVFCEDVTVTYWVMRWLENTSHPFIDPTAPRVTETVSVARCEELNRRHMVTLVLEVANYNYNNDPPEV